MRFDREKFFAGYKAHLDASLTQEQVDGINFLLGKFETDPLYTSIPLIAYPFATTFHETNQAMVPVEEGFYLGDPDRVHRFQKTLRYYPDYGRGYVQLTWDTPKKPNYTHATQTIRKERPSVVADFEARTGQTFDLHLHPEQALDPEIAFCTMTLGMFEGWYGVAMTRYIRGAYKDYVGARHSVNGVDRAVLIAGYAKKFEQILDESLIADDDIQSSAAASPTAAPEPSTEDAADKTPVGGEPASPVQPPTPDSEQSAGGSQQSAGGDTAATKPTWFERATNWQGKLDQISNLKNSLSPFTPSLSPISGQSWVTAVLTKLSGLFSLVWGLIMRDPFAVSVGGLLIVAGLGYLAIAKWHALERFKAMWNYNAEENQSQQQKVEVKL